MRRIDTHHHVVPPFYAQWLTDRGQAAGGLPIPAWSQSSALEFMDTAGVEAAILSVSTPGVHLGDDAQARDMARRVNEYSAEAVASFPRRFGFFASLPLPDVPGAIAEAVYALDTLKADGVVLLANARGIYLGDPAWEPLMAELNARAAVVFVHPSQLPCSEVPGIPAYVADFLLDTTRAALNYAKSGALERYPQLKVILAHAGGFLPFAAERLARIVSPDQQNPGGLARLRQFWFDTALSGSPYAMPALLAFADPARVTFGSDWPYATRQRALHFTALLDGFTMSPEMRQAIERDNAITLFPRLA